MKTKGQKRTRSHTTHIEVARTLLKFAEKSDLVSKISLGVITSLPRSKGGTNKKLKCIIEQACLFLKVRGNRAIQEIRFYSGDVQTLKQQIEQHAHKEGFEII